MRWARPRLGALAWAAFLTALIAGPWLASGYLFGTDWPGPRHFDLPSGLSSSAPPDAALALLSRLLSAELAGKLFLVGLLLAAASTAYAAVPAQGFVPRAAAGAIYIANPFVFGRVHYGQLYLLAGYAVLPWVASRLRLMCAEPSRRSALWLGVSLALVGMFTVHLLLAAGLLAVAVVYARSVTGGDRAQLARSSVAAVAATLVLSSYWLVPFVLGRGPEAGVIAGTGAGELADYRAIPDPTLGLVPNLLGLYGFWAERTGRFTSMKHFVPGWPLVLVAILAVAAIGAGWGLRDRKLRPWTAGLVGAGLVALYLEMGVSSPLSADLVRWLDSTVPAYRGMRDAGKWAALLALAYSQLFGLGSAAILSWMRRVRLPPAMAEAAIGLLLAVPLYYGNGLLFGMHGEVRPSAYPSGWYAADRVLAADPHPGRTLFVPWHEYMRYSFVRNQNAVIACPAPTFFSVPVLCSANPELPGGTPPGASDQVAVSGLVNVGSGGQWARVLAAYGIKYVLVAREIDWRRYAFLNAQPGLQRVGDYGSIALYRDTLWAGGS